MHCNTHRLLPAAILLLAALTTLATAGGKFAVDGLHGLPNAHDYRIDLPALCSEHRFVRLHAERVPMYEILAEGMTTPWDDDTVVVQVPSGAHALYVVLDVETVSPEVEQLPIPLIICPDQTAVQGAFGISHVDNPPPGEYTIRMYWSMTPTHYRVGIGPQIWEVYPPEDYDAVIQMTAVTFALFRGWPTPYADSDNARLQQMLNSGGGVWIVYDGSGPIAEKPIIHLTGMSDGATVGVTIPGRTTYALPAPKTTQPLLWEIPPGNDDHMLYYEGAFARPLNFVSWQPEAKTLANRSWAIARDLHWIEFVPGQGYRLSAVGTLAPTEEGRIESSPALPYMEAMRRLDELLRREAAAAGMTEGEIEPFFTHYSWAHRVLAEVSMSRRPACLYRLEGEDYDALLPLRSDPAPDEMRRILWAYSIFAEESPPVRSVHPPVAATVSEPPLRRQGTLHEYGFLRERYGSRGLDDLFAWGWHFYDETIQDPTDNDGWPLYPLLHSWGGSPLVARLSQGVTQVRGVFCGIVTADAGQTEVVLTGDDDASSPLPNPTFPPGSYPPAVVARREAAGGKLIGIADLEFLSPSYDNLQFVRNILSWLDEDTAAEGPDFDIAVAVIETTFNQGGTAIGGAWVHNLGDQPLQVASTPPSMNWISVTGPANATVPPGDSVAYVLSWNAAGLRPGYHQTTWRFITNDSNEDTLDWPVRLHVLGGSGVEPGQPVVTPSHFDLTPPFPNPFNSQLRLSFTVPRAGDVTISVYNLLGQCVERIPVQTWSMGSHQITLDFSARSAGLYFVCAQHGGSSVIRKVMLLK